MTASSQSVEGAGRYVNRFGSAGLIGGRSARSLGTARTNRLRLAYLGSASQFHNRDGETIAESSETSNCDSFADNGYGLFGMDTGNATLDSPCFAYCTRAGKEEGEV